MFTPPKARWNDAQWRDLKSCCEIQQQRVFNFATGCRHRRTILSRVRVCWSHEVEHFSSNVCVVEIVMLVAMQYPPGISLISCQKRRERAATFLQDCKRFLSWPPSLSSLGPLYIQTFSKDRAQCRQASLVRLPLFALAPVCNRRKDLRGCYVAYFPDVS